MRISPVNYAYSNRNHYPRFGNKLPDADRTTKTLDMFDLIRLYMLDGDRDLVELINKHQNNIDSLKIALDALIEKKVKTACYAEILDFLFVDKNITPQATKEKLNKLLDIRNAAISKRNILFPNKFSKEESGPIDTQKDLTEQELAALKLIDEYFFANPFKLQRTVDLIGMNSFVYSFKDRADAVLQYIESIGDYYWDFETHSLLKEKINPKNSYKYKELEGEIKLLKSRYNSTENNEKKLLEDKINTLTSRQRDMVKKSLKDPKDILNLAIIISGFKDNPNNAKEFLAMLDKLSKTNNINYDNILCELLYKKLKVDNKNVQKNKLDFSNTAKYIPLLLYPTTQFSKDFQNLVDFINKYPDESNLETLNRLTNNIQTKNLFEKYGIDYKKWTEFDPESFIEISDKADNKYIIRKADMNNIPYSIFLGNYVDCCTRVPWGQFAESAVSYVVNKFIGAIEILQNGKPIGNTMCYFALANKELAFIIDNTEFKKGLKIDNTVYESIIDYAAILTGDICGKKVDIYAAGIKDVDEIYKDQPFDTFYTEIIGYCGNHPTYFDFCRSNKLINIENGKYLSGRRLFPKYGLANFFKFY